MNSRECASPECIVEKSPKLFGMDVERGRWLLVLAGMAINLCLGSIFSWSVFVQPVKDFFTVEGFRVSENQALMPFSIFFAALSITMLFAGRAIEKFGPKRTCLAGGILTGLGWIISSFATSPDLLDLSFGILGGMGGGIAFSCTMAVAAKWFPDRSGLAAGLTVFGFGFSAFIVANVAGYLIPVYGLVSTFRIIGIALMIVVSLLSSVLLFPPAGWTPAKGSLNKSKAQIAVRQFTREEMVGTSSFYSLFICYFIGAFSGLAAIGISHEVGVEIIGFNPGQATLAVGLFAVCNALGRPAFGLILDRFQPKVAAMLSFSLICISSLVLYFAGRNNIAVFIAAFSILWACYGGWVTISSASIAKFFGTVHYARCYGVAYLASGTAALAGPQLAGLIDAMTDSYIDFFPVLASFAVAGFLISHFTLKPPASN